MNLVTFIVVVKNGEGSIVKCLSSLKKQHIESLEVLIIDGESDDKTVFLAEGYLKNNNFNYRILNNPKKTLASGWNIAIKSSNSKYLIRPDSHSFLSENYIINGIKRIEKDNLYAAVGGVLETISNTFVGKIISIVLSNPIGVGPSVFRIGLKNEIETDTVVYGVYKKELFNSVGLFNEDLKRNQDIEFHKRAKQKGFSMMTIPTMKAIYYNRPNIKSFSKQAYNNGFWVGKGHGHFRHNIPLFFIITFFTLIFINLSVFLLFLVVYFSSLLISFIFFSKIYNPLKLLMALFLTFMLHLNYGIGTLIGKIR